MLHAPRSPAVSPRRFAVDDTTMDHDHEDADHHHQEGFYTVAGAGDGAGASYRHTGLLHRGGGGGEDDGQDDGQSDDDSEGCDEDSDPLDEIKLAGPISRG